MPYSFLFEFDEACEDGDFLGILANAGFNLVVGLGLPVGEVESVTVDLPIDERNIALGEVLSVDGIVDLNNGDESFFVAFLPESESP